MSFKLFNYRPELHNVRRITAMDRELGYSVQSGSLVAYNGAWDRKGMVTSVETKKPEFSKFLGQKIHRELHCHIVYIGAYLAKRSSRTIGRYNPKAGKWVPNTRQRFEGERYVPAERLSITETVFYVLADGRILPSNLRSGWTLVVPQSIRS